MRFWPVIPTELRLGSDRLGYDVGHLSVVALDFHVRAQGGERREILEDADLYRPGLGHVVEDIGPGRGPAADDQGQRCRQTWNEPEMP